MAGSVDADARSVVLVALLMGISWGWVLLVFALAHTEYQSCCCTMHFAAVLLISCFEFCMSL